MIRLGHLSIVALALVLGGCQTGQSGGNLSARQQAMYDYLIIEGMDKNMALATTLNPALQDVYFDDKKCRGYGAKAGSDAYVTCRAQLDVGHKTQGASPVAQSSGAAGYYSSAVPASDAPVLQNILPPTVRCQSVPAGMGTVQTICR